MANRVPTEEQRIRRVQAQFRRKIIATFTNAGFEYLKTDGIHRRFGLKSGELDYVFIYENIVLICEDTISTNKDHIKNKKLLVDEIEKNKLDTIQWLKDEYKEKFKKFEIFDNSSYKVFHLYLPLNRLGLDSSDQELYDPIKVIEYTSLNYLNITAQTIKRSARMEVFRLLGLTSRDVGLPGAGGSRDAIETTIIYPTNSTGLISGIRIVSFMMSAET